MKNLLTGRSQRVKIGQKLSKSAALVSGVPQGGILSPLLYQKSVPQINEEERQLRSKSKGLLTITGHTTVTRNSFINDGKILWNQCPEEIMQSKTLHPPKTLIKKFVKTLPL